jgi:hypothetical protein
LRRTASVTVRGFVLLVLLMSTSCKSWVVLTPEAEQVRVSAPEAVESCERIGRTKARTSPKAWIFPRREKKVLEELSSLAREDAAEMGGTDVMSLNEEEDGRQDFAIYRCPGQATE